MGTYLCWIYAERFVVLLFLQVLCFHVLLFLSLCVFLTLGVLLGPLRALNLDAV